jgi:hypothetical protein
MSALRIRIYDEAKIFVEDEAERQEVCETTIIRKALAAYRYLREVRAKDGQIVLERPDGTREILANI